MNKLKTMLAASVLMIAGCYQSPPAPQGMDIVLPDDYGNNSSAAEVDLPDKWWQSFNSEELNSLVERALAGNLTIEQAWARLQQAKAVEKQVGAADDMKVNLTAGASTSRIHNNSTYSSDSYGIGLAASYEVDLWGKIDSQKKAASLSVKASKESVNSAATTVVGEIVETWLNIIAQRQMIDILNQQLKVNSDSLELIELRYNMSMVDATDVLRQRQTVKKVEASLLLAESAEKVLLNKLAVLLGEMPGTEFQISDKKLPEIVSVPETGIPSQLLERRPDIRAAMLNVQISNYNLAEAKADKLPAFSLTASYQYDSDRVSSLFDNWIANLAANLTMPLLDGKRLDAEIERNKAVIQENTAAYRQAVIAAVNEVDNALLQEQSLRQSVGKSEEQLEYARQALAQVEDQYRNGVDNYLSVLTELLTVQSLELDLLSSRQNVLLYRVALYRSLGGSWLD